MMFNRDDFQMPPAGELVQFLPIVLFVGLVAPVLLGVYTLSFVMKAIGWLDT